jgi:hypothetical protein
VVDAVAGEVHLVTGGATSGPEGGGKKTRWKNKGSASPRSSGVGIPTQKLVAGPSEIVAGLSVAESDLLLHGSFR